VGLADRLAADPVQQSAKGAEVKAIVTGGAGFIGSHLVRRLLRDRHEVLVIDDLSAGRLDRLPARPLPKFAFSHQSILAPMDFKGADVVFHLAALPRVQRSLSEPANTHNVNVTGTLAVLQAAREAGVKRLVFSSSSSVYGEQTTLPLIETMTPHPLSPYALHKLIGEQYCQLYTRLWGISTVCLRYFNVYGPDMDQQGAYANLIPKFAAAYARGQAPVINGDGEQTRDFCYVEDVVKANLLAAGLPEAKGQVYNIGTGESHSVNSVAFTIATLLKSKLEAEHGPAVVEPKATRANAGRAYAELGWSPTTSLAEGLAHTLEADGYLVAENPRRTR
jgi:UDP-glucose 4-epimerase